MKLFQIHQKKRKFGRTCLQQDLEASSQINGGQGGGRMLACKYFGKESYSICSICLHTKYFWFIQNSSYLISGKLAKPFLQCPLQVFSLNPQRVESFFNIHLFINYICIMSEHWIYQNVPNIFTFYIFYWHI